MKFLKVDSRPDHADFLRTQAGYDPGYEEPGEEYLATGEILQITEAQADKLYEAGKELYQMCLAAVDHVIKHKRFAEFGIGPEQGKLITASWNRDPLPDGTTRDPELYCRFDLAWDGGNNIKFFEANADTPTTTYEASVVQWVMLQDLIKRGELPEGMSQFNSIEEELRDRFKHIYNMASGKVTDTLHLTAVTEVPEDLGVISYLGELAGQAGWKTHIVDVAHIGANEIKASRDYAKLFDEKDKEIKALYKLMPWEHLFEADYSKYLTKDNILMFEPPWRAIMSNKMLSVVLWELFPDHKYLLPTYTSPEKFDGTYVEKPIFGREGSAIKIIFDGKADPGQKQHVPGVFSYQDYPKIYQGYAELPKPEGGPKHGIVTGLWMVGDEPCGMDLRYDSSPITGSKCARFLPHSMVPYPAM
ncbi:MAG: glutathionylspermidine synthase family protein [Micavibrio aeruginosavorus]|uniref:Glutathionylspermidine synthase family protein n=1 Tax=Micavibrio aeruginosavorus TaxID=349221 RepID=A0A2W5MX04_9BACT|nr:MAG: glutathionylspermidine synthase family protein [Micavibrio aeruginosavorus]